MFRSLKYNDAIDLTRISVSLTKGGKSRNSDYISLLQLVHLKSGTARAAAFILRKIQHKSRHAMLARGVGSAEQDRSGAL